MKKVGVMYVGLLSLLVSSAQAAQVEVIDQQALEKRVSRLERMLENPVLLQLSDRLADQQKEIQSMQDRIDRLEFRLRQQRQRTQQQIRALEARLQDLEKRLKQSPKPMEETTSLSVETETMGALSVQKPLVSSKAEAKDKKQETQIQLKAYEAAMTLLRKAKYQAAAQAFDAFLEKYPQASLAPNAAYWAGEAYMVLLQFKPALARFDRVLKDYPESNKYYDSLYRSAEALYKLGQKQAAVSRLKRLIGDAKAPASLKKRAQALLEKWHGAAA